MITPAQGLTIFLAIIILGTLFMWLITPQANTCGREPDRTAYENCLDSY